VSVRARRARRGGGSGASPGCPARTDLLPAHRSWAREGPGGPPPPVARTTPGAKRRQAPTMSARAPPRSCRAVLPPSDTTERMARERTDGRLRVGVVFGGRSGEHEVSLASAASVMAAMDGARFEVVPIGITREGRWLVGGDPMRALTEAASRQALTEGGAESDVKRGLAARA